MERGGLKDGRNDYSPLLAIIIICFRALNTSGGMGSVPLASVQFL